MDGENTSSFSSDQKRQTILLPDGIELHVLNDYEASFVVKEIYEGNSYPLESIAAVERPVIIDIGANIGIFVRYALGICPSARVFAFEPAPQIFELLRLNTAPMDANICLERSGISDAPGQAEFTYYPNYSLLSSFKAAPEEDAMLLRSGISSQLATNPRLAGRVTDRHVNALAEGKLDGAKVIECPLNTLSHYISLHNLERVDFLKIDAERCELQILRGIQEKHWPLIQCVCMEIHESLADDPTTQDVCGILKGQGFHLTLQPNSTEHPRTILLHAIRTS
jgi:phthiocerol/phenolphthiocerol synthesis type-I polyketide synthase E